MPPVLVNLLHHGRCFDGAASAALFAEFYRRHVDPAADFLYRPKRHRTGDPYDESDFGQSVNASVDFRYSQDPRLHWYFDHHKSAFQLPGDREHFLADRSGRKFHDESAPSCASYIARVCRERWGYDATPHAELIRWTETIDQATFPDPATPVLFTDPAMQVASVIQVVEDRDTLAQLIADLTVHPLARVAQAEYVQRVFRPQMQRHREDMDLIRVRASVRADVLAYDLLDLPPRVFSHFIPYYHHPEIRYVVGCYRHLDDDLRITVGYNPWLDPDAREHDIAGLCERFGGGGHAHVGGVSFPPGEGERCATVFGSIVDVLRRGRT